MKIIAFTGAGISKQSGIPTFKETPQIRKALSRNYAISNPKEYNKIIRNMKQEMEKAKPNDAHHALFEYNIPIITMNIDDLHQKAGSQPLELHGTLPKDNELAIAHTLDNKPVLYGDPAPNYKPAFSMILSLDKDDTLLIIGCSYHTSIACHLRDLAKSQGVKIIEIQKDAATNVRKILERIFNNH